MNLKTLIGNLVPEKIKIAFHCSRRYKKAFGHYPNLIFPTTYNEKIQKRKVFDRDPRLPLMSDKVLIKDFVSQKLGNEYVIPTLWHGTKLPPRDSRTWPKPYVIKANHGSTWNIFVRSDDECNWDDIEQRCDKWMSEVWGRGLGEWLYTQIKPQILIEPFIGEADKLPRDYKLWIFNGKAEIIEVMSDRGIAVKEAFYDRNWNRLPFSKVKQTIDPREIPPPETLAEMIAGAESLAEDIPFVRADFYEVNGKPLFGEMTFYPSSGIDPRSPSGTPRPCAPLTSSGRRSRAAA